MEWKVPERMRRILLDLAGEGPSTGYRVAARIGMSQSSAYDGLRALSEKGLVEARVDPEWGDTLKKRDYGLTVLGFSHALRLTYVDQTEAWRSFMDQKIDFAALIEAAPKVLSQLNNIIDQWSDLIPLVLGKWSLFKEAGVADQAIFKLNLAALNQVFGEGGSTSWVAPYPSSDPVEVFTYDFYNPFLGLGSLAERCRWAAACARDPDIRKYLTKRLKQYKEVFLSFHREVEIMGTVLEAKDPSAMAEALEGKTGEAD